MMMILLAKGRLCPTIHPLLPRFFSCASASASASAAQSPGFDAAHYLVSRFGFSSGKAARVSTYMAHLKSPENPDSVLRFLKDHGFSEADINKLITLRPELLRSSPEKTLDPNLRALRDMGLSASALNQIILSGPQALNNQNTVPRIRFWMDFFDHDEAALVTAFKQNLGLVGLDFGRLVSPKISLLRSRGFSTQDIRMILCKVPRFITSRTGGMENLLNRTKELGFHPGSAMFLPGLHAMVCVTRDELHKKMEFLMSFGWSENDFFAAMLKAPTIVSFKEKTLQAKINFLMGEARCEPSYIASHPVLLTLSLGQRMRPRHHVMRLLESKGLCSNGQSFSAAMTLSNTKFVERYIIKHKKVVPELHEEYLAACVSESG